MFNTPAAARGSGSMSPESQQNSTGLRSRLAIPRDWRSSVNRRKSEDSACGSGNGGGSVRKEQQQQSSLEMDGEWFGDALDTDVSVSEKVRCHY